MVEEVPGSEDDSRDTKNPRLTEFRRIRKLPIKQRRQAILAILTAEFEQLEIIYLEGIAVLEAREASESEPQSEPEQNTPD